MTDNGRDDHNLGGGDSVISRPVSPTQPWLSLPVAWWSMLGAAVCAALLINGSRSFGAAAGGYLMVLLAAVFLLQAGWVRREGGTLAVVVGCIAIASPVIAWVAMVGYLFWGFGGLGAEAGKAAGTVRLTYGRDFPEASWSVDCRDMTDFPGECDAIWTPRRALSSLEYYQWQRRFQAHDARTQNFIVSVRPSVTPVCPGVDPGRPEYPSFDYVMGIAQDLGPPVEEVRRTVAWQIQMFEAHRCRLVNPPGG